MAEVASTYFDVDQILTEEEVAELYYDYAEDMQDLGMDYYDSEDEIMQGTEGEDQGQQNTEGEDGAGDQQMEQPTDNGTQHIQRKNLTMNQRREVVDSMLVNMRQGNLPRGHLKHLSVNYNVHKSTITRIFSDVKKQMAHGNLVNVRSKKLGRVGRKAKQFSDAFLQSVPLHLRQIERSYVAGLQISQLTLHKLKRKGRLRTHTCTNKPTLTSDHKIARMKWILSRINPLTSNENSTFVDMNHVIHVDEKWFYLNPDKRRFYLLPSEEDPYMAIQSKRFKFKAMFMGLIGKPLYDTDGGLLHDGKYGMFPFTVKQLAKKSSKNRAAGTWETKAIQNVNREVIRDMLVTNVIPSIILKRHHSQPKNILIQWDNARPHQVPTDAEFLAATTAHGFNINFVFQPAQSPDLNVLDVGLFRSIQSLQYQSFPSNLVELVTRVQESYEAFNPQVNKYIWLSLQKCMIEILKVQGGNKYKLPHMNKKKLENLGQLPNEVAVHKKIVLEAVEYLDTVFRPVNEGTDQGTEDGEVDAD